eukprot:TRINITY_DN2081_c0_g1_i1.p1 TRINITY_DN2081_c0_g1~~TRINITY_DN2081_c0_g1_i1.p1  ORF type:complete len:65 (-),score=1.57 TRINITY_DN2081_c0_g1_i1:129-323(-)
MLGGGGVQPEREAVVTRNTHTQTDFNSSLHSLRSKKKIHSLHMTCLQLHWLLHAHTSAVTQEHA